MRTFLPGKMNGRRVVLVSSIFLAELEYLGTSSEILDISLLSIDLSLANWSLLEKWTKRNNLWFYTSSAHYYTKLSMKFDRLLHSLDHKKWIIVQLFYTSNYFAIMRIKLNLSFPLFRHIELVVQYVVRRALVQTDIAKLIRSRI